MSSHRLQAKEFLVCIHCRIISILYQLPNLFWNINFIHANIHICTQTPPTNKEKSLHFLANTYKAQSTEKIHNVQMPDQMRGHVLVRLHKRKRLEGLMTGGCDKLVH